MINLYERCDENIPEPIDDSDLEFVERFGYSINEAIIDCWCEIASQFKKIEGGTILEWFRRCKEYYINTIHRSDYLYLQGSVLLQENYNMIAWDMGLKLNMNFDYYHDPKHPSYLTREAIMAKHPLKVLRTELHEFTTSSTIAMYAYWLLYDGGLEWIVCHIQQWIQRDEYLQKHPETKEVYINWQRWIITYSIKYGLESKDQWIANLQKLSVATYDCHIDLVELDLEEKKNPPQIEWAQLKAQWKERFQEIKDYEDGLIDELPQHNDTEDDYISMKMKWDGSVFLTSKESSNYSSLSNITPGTSKGKKKSQNKLSSYQTLEDVIKTKEAFDYFINICTNSCNDSNGYKKGDIIARVTVVFEECNALKIDNIEGSVVNFFNLFGTAGIDTISCKTFQNYYRVWKYLRKEKGNTLEKMYVNMKKDAGIKAYSIKMIEHMRMEMDNLDAEVKALL